MKYLKIIGLIALIALAGYTATYRLRASTPTEASEINTTVTDSSKVVEFRYVSVFTEIGDSIVHYQPVLCDTTITGKFELFDDGLIIIWIGDAPRHFHYVGNYSGDKSVMELVDMENKRALLYTRTLDNGTILWAVQTAELLVIFSEIPHPCHAEKIQN